MNAKPVGLLTLLHRRAVRRGVRNTNEDTERV